MRVYHQCGHNYIWNINSFEEDNVGDGLILSPINMSAESITGRISQETLSKSFFDPQFYLPYDAKQKLEGYKFFPANVVDEKTTSAIGENIDTIAQDCIDFQIGLGLQYVVIPTRYYESFTNNTLDEISTLIVEPFIKSYTTSGHTNDLLLTSIISQGQLEHEDSRDELLSWITGFSEITGIYLIFANAFTTKQIIDPGYLTKVLGFIDILRKNELEVHIGYSGLEGLLFSIADVTSISVGSFENLRRFDIGRMQISDSSSGGPATARIFSDKLIHNVPVTVTPALDTLYPNWKAELIPETSNKSKLMDSPEKLHFTNGDLYKHYFAGVVEMVASLPKNKDERIAHIDNLAKEALDQYEKISSSGIVFGADVSSDHLVAWRNAIAMYNATTQSSN